MNQQLCLIRPLSRVTRPALRYFGGKWNLAPWLLTFFPPHTHYLEPFGGAFSVGLRKTPCSVEYYNEINPRILNFMGQVQTNVKPLIARIQQMPPASDRTLYAAWDASPSPLEDATRLYYLSHYSFSGVGGRWLGGTSNQRMARPLNPTPLHTVAERLQNVSLWGLDFRVAIAKVSANPSTLIYCDPPYLHQTRSHDKRHSDRAMSRAQYAHELTEQDHRELAHLLNEANCMAIVSGYPSKLYSQLYRGWFTTTKLSLNNARTSATEMLWINPMAYQHLWVGAQSLCTKEHSCP